MKTRPFNCWYIHIACKIRGKAQGPRSSNQPCKWLCSSPHIELSAQFRPSPKTKKRKRTTPKACPDACHVVDIQLTVTVSQAKWKKEVLSQLSVYKPLQIRKWWLPGPAASCSTPSTDRWEMKKGQQFTLLRRITNYKSVNSESDWRIDSFP